MQKLHFTIELSAPKEKVWEALWEDSNYRIWSNTFCEGSYAETDNWKEGSKVLFLSPGGNGMVSEVAKNIPNELMLFKHLGEVKNGIEDTSSENVKAWAGAIENYALSEEDGKTILTVSLDSTEEFKDYFLATWPKALDNIKELVNIEPVIIEKTLNAPVEKVWQAITDNSAMKKWYFDIAEFKPEPGFEFSFAGEGNDGEKYIHLCKITEMVPLKKLTYSWRYDGFEGISFVTFKLFADGGKTKLTLTHRGLHTFPSATNGAFAQENFVAGWTQIIGTSLKDFTENAS